MEKIPTGEYAPAQLFEQVTTMKRVVMNSGNYDLITKMTEEILLFNQRLTKTLEKYNFDPLVREGVPEWSRLVGGTPEYYQIDASARIIILEEIQRFTNEFIANNNLEMPMVNPDENDSGARS